MGRKWANIVAKKTAKDGANSKVYAKFGVEIYVAAKKGEPDPESNSGPILLPKKLPKMVLTQKFTLNLVLKSMLLLKKVNQIQNQTQL